jgi:hypothetical protein
MCRNKISCWTILILSISLLAFAGNATAATTFGSALTGTPTVAEVAGSNHFCQVQAPNTPQSCTLAVGNLSSPAEAAAGGTTAPISGVLVGWRVAVGATPSATSLKIKPRLLTESGLHSFTVTASGQAQSIPNSGGTFAFADRIPVVAGQFLGIDVTTNGAAGADPLVLGSIGTSGGYVDMGESPADGVTTSSIASLVPAQAKLMVNADIEPDADHDGFGDETQDACPQRADIQTACPPPTITGAQFTNAHLFVFNSDLPGSVATTIERSNSGRLAKGKCKPKARAGKRCSFFTKVAAFDEPVTAGQNSVSYAFKVGSKELPAGKYRATLVVTSQQNTSSVEFFNFAIKKKSKKSKK